MMSNISSDMNKPCWKLAKACPQSQILFCSRENNLPKGVFTLVPLPKIDEIYARLKDSKIYSTFDM